MSDSTKTNTGDIALNTGDIALIAATLGLPLIQPLVATLKPSAGPVTEDEWAELLTLSNYSSQQSLATLGFKIVDGKLVHI